MEPGVLDTRSPRPVAVALEPVGMPQQERFGDILCNPHFVTAQRTRDMCEVGLGHNSRVYRGGDVEIRRAPNLNGRRSPEAFLEQARRQPRTLVR